MGLAAMSGDAGSGAAGSGAAGSGAAGSGASVVQTRHIVGDAGASGFPGYSGTVSNPMLTSAVIVGRESNLSGGAAWDIYGSKAPFIDPMPWLSPSTPVRADLAIERLDPVARGVLAEMELLEGLTFESNHTRHGPSAELLLRSHPPTKLVSINGFEDGLGAQVFQRQTLLVQAYAALRMERQAEVLAQVVPQTAQWSAITSLSPDTHRYSIELLGVALRFTMMNIMRMKRVFDVKRAWLRSALIQPMILTPAYTSYPSGHATEAHFAAEFLPLLAGDPEYMKCQAPKGGRRDSMTRQMNRLAYRIAENRVVAGLHYPIDAVPGQALGVMLARYVVWVASAGQAWPSLKIGAKVFHARGDVDGDEVPTFDALLHEQPHITPPATSLSIVTPMPPAPVLQALWRLARREWERI